MNSNIKGRLSYLGYIIPYCPKEFQNIKNDLTVTPWTLPDYTFKVEKFKLYRLLKDPKEIILPKYYGLEKYGVPVEDKERKGKPIDLKFNGSLKDNQIKVIEKVWDELMNKDSAVLCLPCGFGKTVLALYLISKLKTKTLVVVHKTFLMDQWIERIQQFLPEARIGIIRQNITDTEDKDIVIAMLQSLTVRKVKYPKRIFDDFGYVTYDECHHLPSQTFSESLFQIGTKKRLGLSATPERKDKLDCVLGWFLGDIIKFDPPKKEFNTTVRTIKAKYEKPPTVKFNSLGKLNLAGMITDVSMDPQRNMQICELLMKLISEKRQILVLSERRKQCIELQLYFGDELSGLYIGGMNSDDLEESNKKQLIFATYSMAHEGYDCPKLDTLVMVSGRSDIVQAVGRIHRRVNENSPLIVDILDDVDGLKGQYYKRKSYYKKSNYKLESDYEIKDNNDLFLD